jgi:release factor glutamine methyltransferase
MRSQPQVKGAVIDVCTGSGAVAVAAARAGATFVTAVDVSRRALISTSLNARLNGVNVRTRRGDLLDAVPDERFDLIVSNPPYLPAPERPVPRGRARHTDGGPDGRSLLDRLIEQAPAHLLRGGLLLVTHSSINDEQQTLERMHTAGLEPRLLERRRGSLGPLLAARAPALEGRGLLAPEQRDEDLVIVAGAAGG